MATEPPTDPQIAVDADRYLAQRVLALEAEVERLESDHQQLTKVLHELGIRYEFTQYGVRFTSAALAGEGGEDG